MFQLSIQKFESLRLQFETSNRGGKRYLPFTITEQRIAEILDIITEMNTIKTKPLNPIGYTAKKEK